MTLDRHAPARAGARSSGRSTSTPTTPAAATAGSCWCPARRASASPASSRRSSTGSGTPGSPGAPATEPSRRRRSGRSRTWPTSGAARSGPPAPTGVPREARFAALLSMLRDTATRAASPSWSWRTCTSPTRRPWTCSGTLPGGCAASGAMVVATYRDDGLAEHRALRETLGDVVHVRSTRRIDLPPLSPAAVTELSAAIGPRGGCRARSHRWQPVLRERGAAARSRDELPRRPGTRCCTGRPALSRRTATCSTLPPWSASAWSPTCWRRSPAPTPVRPRRTGRRRTAGRRRDGPAVPPRDRPAGSRAGGRPARRRRGAPPASSPSWSAPAGRRRPAGPPRRGSAGRGDDRAPRPPRR